MRPATNLPMIVIPCAMIVGRLLAIVDTKLVITCTTLATICGRLLTIPVTRLSSNCAPACKIVGRFWIRKDANVVMSVPAVVISCGMFSSMPFAMLVKISTPFSSNPGSLSVIPSKTPWIISVPLPIKSLPLKDCWNISKSCTPASKRAGADSIKACPSAITSCMAA